MPLPSIAAKRIKREFQECNKSEVKSCGLKLSLTEGDMSNLTGEITGPPDTPYEGGIFKVTIHIPEQYPFQPPECKFATKIWHPNISSQTGAICLDILKKGGDAWAAAMTLRTVLLSLQLLLQTPVPDDPQDAVVAGQFQKDHKAFCDQAASWTKEYAK